MGQVREGHHETGKWVMHRDGRRRKKTRRTVTQEGDADGV